MQGFDYICFKCFSEPPAQNKGKKMEYIVLFRLGENVSSLKNDDHEIITYESEQEAVNAAENHFYVGRRDYQIIELTI